jgi:mRNA interferase MazF
MLTSGDVIELDLGAPQGREAGFARPAVVVTAQRVLRRDPAVVHAVPLTSTLRRYESEVVIEPDERNGLGVASAAQCQHLRAVSAGRLGATYGNVGAVDLARIRDTVAMLLDIPE